MMYPVIVSQPAQNVEQGINNSSAPQPAVYYTSADQLSVLSTTTTGGGGNISNVMLPVNHVNAPSPHQVVTFADFPPTYQQSVGSNIPKY